MEFRRPDAHRLRQPPRPVKPNRQVRWRARASAETSSDVEAVELVLEMPPSVNELYIKRAGGRGLALSKKATHYRRVVQSTASEHPDIVLGMFPIGDQETAYAFDIQLFFKAVENKGWHDRITKGPRKGERKAETRYKKVDTDNRVKFLQDAVCRAIGMPDDCQVFDVRVRKFASAGEPWVRVRISVIDVDPHLEVHHEPR